MIKQKKQPARSCKACGRTANKQQLVRFVRTVDGQVFCDGSGKLPGRGAYLCANEQCFELAFKKRCLSRALKCEINDAGYQRLRSEHQELCAEKIKMDSTKSAIDSSDQDIE